MLRSEFFPSQKSDSKKLMIVLHGLGDSSAGFHWLPPTLNLPDMNYQLVNAPDIYYGGYSWYDFAGDQASGVVRSRQLLFDLLDGRRKDGFPTEQTTMLGFSQGCLMTIDVATRYPHRFAGLVGISGYVHGPEKIVGDFSPLAGQQRFLITHGFQDPIIPFKEVKIQIQDLKNAGLNIRWEELAKAHTIAGKTEVKIIRDFVEAGYPV